MAFDSFRDFLGRLEAEGVTSGARATVFRMRPALTIGDPANAIAESNEGNNTASKLVTVQGGKVG